MLTDSEREWLEHRDAMQFLTGTYIADFAEYPLWNSGKDWQEAAEFEARVAAMLAKGGLGIHLECHGEPILYRHHCPQRKNFWKCSNCFLKYARLQVEEEMENETNS